MTTPPNIEAFNRTTAALLAQLYEQFPKLQVIITDNDPALSDEDAFEHYLGTVDFLMHEGFVYGKIDRMMGTSAVLELKLTGKGFTVLNATPASLEERKTLGQRLGALAKGGGGEALNAVVNEVVTTGVSLLFGGA